MLLAQAAHILTSPLVHVPAAMLFFYVVKKCVYSSFPSKSLYLIAGLWLFYCSGTYTSSTLIHRLEHAYPTVLPSSSKWIATDAIVILACYYFDDEGLPKYNQWPRCSLQRLLQAVDMYRFHNKQIIVSGGNLGNWSKSLAEYSRDFLVKQGVDAKSITVIPDGFNTESEVEAICATQNFDSVSMITSASHQLRASKEFEKHNVKVINVPVDFLTRTEIKFELSLPNADSLKRSERALHEYMGLLAQSLRN